jgi:hypothetical protein
MWPRPVGYAACFVCSRDFSFKSRKQANRSVLIKNLVAGTPDLFVLFTRYKGNVLVSPVKTSETPNASRGMGVQVF